MGLLVSINFSSQFRMQSRKKIEDKEQALIYLFIAYQTLFRVPEISQMFSIVHVIYNFVSFPTTNFQSH